MKLGIFLRGCAMGLCDLVPGISGGSIALMTGIYQRLIYAISHCNFKALSLLLRGKFYKLAEYLDIYFLSTLLAGIIFSVFIGSHLIHYLLSEYKEILYCFFIAIIGFSGIKIITQHSLRNIHQFLAVFLGLIAGLSLAFIPEYQLLDPNSWQLFYVGILIAIIMLLPGISGSVILLLLGLYEPAILAIKQLDIFFIFYLGGGVIVGLGIGSRGMKMLLLHTNSIILFLAAFMLGSIGVIWSKSGIESYYILAILLLGLAVVFIKYSRILLVILPLILILSACQTQIPRVPAKIERVKNNLHKHIVSTGDTITSIAWIYRKDVLRLMEYNNITDGKLRIGQAVLLNIPKKHKRKQDKQAKKIIQRSSIVTDVGYKGHTPKRWLWPVKKRKTIANQVVGKGGITIVTPQGSKVVASADGLVVYQGKSLGSYGNLILIKHSKRFISAYAYHKKILVKTGDVVKAGQPIALSGFVPHSRQSALYFEIRKTGHIVQTIKYLRR